MNVGKSKLIRAEQLLNVSADRSFGTQLRRRRWGMPVALMLCWGIPIAGCRTADLASKPVTAAGYLATTQARLHGALWVHTSAEYEAICRQTFRLAAVYVKTEAARKRSGGGRRDLAVVMDLDFTVLDDSAYIFQLAAGDLVSSRDQWRYWVRHHVEQVALVPGAREFIDFVRGLGVSVVFISGRSDSQFDATLAALKRLDLVPAGATAATHRNSIVFLTSETRGKAENRRLVEERYLDGNAENETSPSGVLAYLGDDLADFSDRFEPDQCRDYDTRRARVRDFDGRWGTGWFVLPNPIYGGWAGILTRQDVANLLHAAVP